MKQSKNALLTALGAIGGAGAGPGTAARRIICELRALKPRATKSVVPEAKAVGAIGPEMSAIVCTLGKSEKLISAVRSLENQTLPRGEYEIIVVSSGGRLDAELEKKLGGAKIITVPEAGLSRARNAGAAAAGGIYLTYIDDDAIAAPDLLESVRGAFKAHKNAGVIGGQVLLRRTRTFGASSAYRATGTARRSFSMSSLSEPIFRCSTRSSTRRAALT